MKKLFSKLLKRKVFITLLTMGFPADQAQAWYAIMLGYLFRDWAGTSCGSDCIGEFSVSHCETL